MTCAVHVPLSRDESFGPALLAVAVCAQFLEQLQTNDNDDGIPNFSRSSRPERVYIYTERAKHPHGGRQCWTST
jgi:hypothetical protein